jgi:hypothetical protein
VLQHQENIRTLGDNPPGTAQMLLGTGQFIQAAALAGSLMTGNVTGIATSGAFVIGPDLLSRLLVSPKGVTLMTEVAQAAPGTRAARQSVQRLAIFAGQELGQRVPVTTESGRERPTPSMPGGVR